LFTDLDVAHFWRLTPSQYFECSEEDQALMQAYMETVKDMESIELYEAEKERERQK
jgi:hypothetical protein